MRAMTDEQRSDRAQDRLWAVVPAGGAGTRLWPLSRAGSPKFLLDLTGSGRTLIQATVDRLVPVVGERVVVVTGAAHEEAVRRQLPGIDRVVAEPSPRDSMAAIGLAAAILELEDPEALIGSFAADHVITDEDAFAACISEAAEVAASGLLVTIGIEPAHPSTGFGYVRSGAALEGFPTARVVTEFVEKPSAERRTTPTWPRACVRSPPTRPCSRSAGPVSPGSRSTTRSPSPPRRPGGWRRCPAPSGGRTSATSRPWPR
jgi:mannose-1-phosphate guanylyltransferase